MKIIELSLKGAYRLALSGIKEIHYTPETKINAIIGANGSGKSSLMHYLSPLPADKNDFEKDGYKKITIEHLDKTYILTSDFSINKHSFVIAQTQEELNVGGTLTMQKQLVQDYFNYNEKIHLLLTGKDKFTQMSPAKRKEWFTLLCDADYSYALKVYQNAKEKHRDAVGALKKVTQHLMQLSAQPIESDEILQLDNRIAQAEENIANYTKMAPFKEEYQKTNFSQFLDQEYTNRANDIKNDTIKLNKYLKWIANRLISPNVYQQYVLDLDKDKMVYHEYNGQYRNLIQQYTELEKQLKSMNTLSDTDKTTLTLELNKLKEKANQIQQQVILKTNQYGYAVDNIELRYKTLDELEGKIQDSFYGLTQVSGEEINQKTLDDYQAKIDHERTKLTDIRIKFNRIDEKIDIMVAKEKEKKLACPNCHHEFHPGYDPELLDKLKQYRVQMNQEMLIQEQAIVKLQTEYQSIKEQYQYILNFMHLAKEYSYLLREFAVDVLKNKWYIVSPQEIYIRWNDYKEHLKGLFQYEQLVSKMNHLENQLQEANKIDSIYYDKLKQDLQSVSRQIEHLKSKMDHLKRHIDTREKIIQYYQDYQLTQERLKTHVDQQNDCIVNISNYVLYEAAQLAIAHERSNISTLSMRKMEILTKEKTIEQVEKQRLKLEEEVNVYQAIIDGLNPNDGLIAEGLLGYIGMFLAKVNGLIATVWSYPLTVFPAKDTESDNDELSYRFPIKVGRNGRLLNDVSLGSDGIIEVIDLAFKMIAMKALGLKGYPIYLDEFGRTFDAKHRGNALRLIEKISEEFIDDQIFMVSHLYTEYAILNNISYCVLAEENIVLPANNVNLGVNILR